MELDLGCLAVLNGDFLRRLLYILVGLRLGHGVGAGGETCENKLALVVGFCCLLVIVACDSEFNIGVIAVLRSLNNFQMTAACFQLENGRNGVGRRNADDDVLLVRIAERDQNGIVDGRNGLIDRERFFLCNRGIGRERHLVSRNADGDIAARLVRKLRENAVIVCESHRISAVAVLHRMSGSRGREIGSKGRHGVVIRHRIGNRVIHRLDAGVVVACCERINEFGVGTLEARACITAAAEDFPHNNLCSDPLLTVGTAEVLFIAGLAVQKSDVHRLLLILAHAVPNGGLTLDQRVAGIEAVTGLNAVGVFAVGIDAAKILAGSADRNAVVGNGAVVGDDIAAGIIAIVKGDRRGVACFRARGDNENG